jgi:hypothetical protein
MLSGSIRLPLPPGPLVDIDRRFAKVIAHFAKDQTVEFGGGAFVAKLPRERAAELVSAGAAEYFNPGSGRPMNEWAARRGRSETWLELATEARQFVDSQQRSPAAPTRPRKRRAGRQAYAAILLRVRPRGTSKSAEM